MISDKLTTEQVNGAKALIEQSDNIVILTHLSPDGDAMGSSLGLMHWIKTITRATVHIVVPNSFPSFLEWMPGAKDIIVYEGNTEKGNQLLAAADLAVCTDFNEPKRIGSLGDRLMEEVEKRHIPVLLIDHHLHPSEMASVCISYPESPSASEIVYRLIHQWGNTTPITLDTARCLYTGMMTDTGNFSFNSNYPEMYEIVGQLVSAGVNKDEIYNAVFNQYSADRMRLMGYCLYQKMRLFPDRHVALIYLSRKELYRFNFQSGDAEGIVNLPLQIGDVYYSVFMREDKVNPSEVNLAGGSKIKVKISLRSQGDRPVNIFAHEIFGGGGHKNASGGEYYGPIADAVKKFLENYEKYLGAD